MKNTLPLRNGIIELLIFCAGSSLEHQQASFLSNVVMLNS